MIFHSVLFFVAASAGACSRHSSRMAMVAPIGTIGVRKREGPAPKAICALQERLQSISLCDRYTDHMLNVIDEWEKAEQDISHSDVQNLSTQIKASETRMEKLVSAYLDGDIPKATYLKQKDKLMRSLATLKAEMKDFERRGNTWVDPYRISTPCGSFVSQSSQKPSQGLAKLGRTSFSPLREWVNDTKQAAFLSSSDNFKEIASFVQKIGTNHAVRDKTARFSVPSPFQFVAKRRAFLPTPAPAGRGQSALSSDEVRFSAPARTRTQNTWSEARCDIHFTTGAVVVL